MKKDTAIESKVVRLSKIPGIPDRPDMLREIGRNEWDRVVPRLFSMGRMSKLYMASLAEYCTSYGEIVELTQKFSQCKDEREQRLLKSNLRQARKHCREAALDFGFRLDSSGRMDLEKPVSLTAASNILNARRERQEKRIRDRSHLDSLPEWLQVPTSMNEIGCKEWARVVPALYAKKRLRSVEDRDLLFSYCLVFGHWRQHSDALRDFRRDVGSTKPEHEATLDSLSNRVETEFAFCKKFSRELGSFFEVPKGLNIKKIATR